MKTKLAPIGADPIGNFVKTLPRTATVLSCKSSRSATQKVIYIMYLENGKLHNAHCHFSVWQLVHADIEVVSTGRKGGEA